MNSTLPLENPKNYDLLLKKSSEIGFTMPSDIYVGCLLKTLVASKPNSRILEIGTGIGLSLSWMVEGLDRKSKLISIDNDLFLINTVMAFFKNDPRIQLICKEAGTWLKNYSGGLFDLVFADSWPGKYSEIDHVLSLIKVGGFYVIDDMIPQQNWPEGHHGNVKKLITQLEARKDFTITKMEWSTGIILMTKRN